MANPTVANQLRKRHSLQWFIGGVMATCFSMVYFVTPFYMLSCLAFAFVISWKHALVYAAPLIVSAILPPMGSPMVLRLLTPMLNYFEYEEIHETNGFENIIDKGINYLLIVQPHGAISFAGICSAVNARQESQGTVM